MTAAERVASFLVELMARFDAQHTLALPMPREDIADYLGLTVETVSRVLSALKQAGVIALPTPQRVLICNRHALFDLAES